MRNYTVLSLLLVHCLLFTVLEATTDLIYITKEQAYQQFENNQPDSPESWTFGTGALGNDQLTAASVTFPGAPTPTPIAGIPGEYELETLDFATQTELDTAYPDGSYAFSFTDNEINQDLGPFTLTGGDYPNTPHIINAVELQESDHSQPFQLTWNAFADYSTGDEILIQIWDNFTDQSVISEFVDAAITSYEIPGGLFSPDRYYDVAVTFIGKADAAQTEGIIVGYLTTTSYQLSTYTSDTRLLFYKWRGQEQTGAGQYGEADYRMLTTVTGISRTVSGAQLLVPGSGVPVDLGPFGQNAFIRSTPFGPKETLDASYPAGQYSFNVTEDGFTTTYGPYPLQGDAYPDPPEVQNFAELANIDPTQAQTITWNATPVGVSLIQLLVLDESDFRVWSDSFGPGVSTTQIPADTLVADQSYRLIIRFWAPSSTNTNPPTALGYISSISLPVSTFPDTGDTTLELAYILKGREYTQEANEVPSSPVSWRMNAGLSGGAGISSVTLNHPGGTTPAAGSEGDFDLEGAEYPDKAGLDGAYPSGEYGLSYSAGGTPENLGPYQIAGDLYPNAPHLQNVADIEGHPFDQSFELTWNPFETATVGDLVVLEVYDETNDTPVVEEFLDPTITSYVISANKFAEGRYYEVSLLFIKKVAANSSPEVVVGYMSRTNFRLSTHTSDSSLILYKTFNQTQVGPSALEEDGYRPLVLARSRSRMIEYAEIQTPTTVIPLTSWAPGQYLYTTGPAAKELLDTDFPAGEYWFGLVEDGGSIGYGPYSIPEDAYADQPIIQNYNQLLAIDPTIENLIEWNTPPEGVTGIGLVIRDSSFRQVWSTGAPPTETSSAIPANLLKKGEDHSITLTFWVKTDESITPQVIAGFGTTTRLLFRTTYSGAYMAWLEQYFTEEQIQNPDIVGEGVDFDGDKSSNYFEYLAGLDPTDRNSKVGIEFKPGGQGTLVMGPLNEALIWELQSSVDLDLWNTVGEGSYVFSENRIHIGLGSFPEGTLFRLFVSETMP